MIKHSMKKLFLLHVLARVVWHLVSADSNRDSERQPDSTDGSNSRDSGSLNGGASINGITYFDVVPVIRSRRQNSPEAGEKAWSQAWHHHRCRWRRWRSFGGSENIPEMVIPLVADGLMTIFGAPVLIVMVIGIIALMESMRQRTIRMMVEGQPVPAEIRPYDTRHAPAIRCAARWSMVGLGLMIWLAAVNDWEGGAWSFGLIPFLIGLGYLWIVWKLENKGHSARPRHRNIAAVEFTDADLVARVLADDDQHASANSCGGINRACAVCFGNSPAQTLLWQMTSRRKLFSGPTKTFAAFAVKRGFPRGFIDRIQLLSRGRASSQGVGRRG